jgi:iron complex outermembrane recepter protein
MYARNSSEANYGPSGLFTYTAATISCGGAAGVNPLLSAQEVSILCAPGVIAANQAAFPQNAGTSNINLYVGRRAVENGPREDNYLSNSFRETLGVKGKWIEGLSYDFYGQVGINTMHDSQGNYINATSGTNALNVVTDPKTGQPACVTALDGTAPTCVPWNIFAKGGVTPAAIGYIDVPATYSITTKEYIVDGSVTADLEKMGMKLPTASSGPSINLGAEYRSESYVLDPDYIFANGLNSGGNGAQSASTVDSTSRKFSPRRACRFSTIFRPLTTCRSMPATATPSTPPASTPIRISSALNTRRSRT